MAEVDVSDTLKITFQERCLAVVNRGLGDLAISGEVTYEIRVNVDSCPASFFRGDWLTAEDGKRTILWSGFWLDAHNKMSKSVEQVAIDPPERPTLASEEVMSRYLVEDLRNMFARDLPETILINHLEALDEAEKLGLLDVTADDVLDAIATMDELIAAHDATG